MIINEILFEIKFGNWRCNVKLLEYTIANRNDMLYVYYMCEMSINFNQNQTA